QRPREAPDFQPDRALVFLEPVMEIDAKRTLLGETLDHPNITGRDRWRVGLVESFGERVPVTAEELAYLVGRIDQCQCLAEPIGPGADNGRDLALEYRSINCGRCAPGTADDEVDPDQRPFAREVGIERRDAPVECVRQAGTD